MGELIDFKRGRGGDWNDPGDPAPDEVDPPPEPPKFRLLMLPVWLFIDAMALVIGFVCQPVPTSLLIIGMACCWSGLRVWAGLGTGSVFLVGILVWLIALALGGRFEAAIAGIESAEVAAMRWLNAKHPGGGRILHLALYLYAALVPLGLVALFCGFLRVSALMLPVITVQPVLSLGLMALVLVGTITSRYRWHPVARHLNLLGIRRGLTIKR